MDKSVISIPEILSSLESFDPEESGKAFGKLKEIGSQAVPYLICSVNRGTPSWQRSIRRFFEVAWFRVRKRLGSNPQVSLHEIWHLESHRCAIAAQLLGQIRNSEAVPCLIRALDGSDYLCTCAAGALGEIGDPRAVLPLIELLQNPKKGWVARGAAAVALGEMGESAEKALPTLQTALTYDCNDSSEEWDLRSQEAVIDAIDRITGRSAKSNLHGHGFRYEMWGIY